MVRPSGPSILRAAVASPPGVARGRPMAPRDRNSIRKLLYSRPNTNFRHHWLPARMEGSVGSIPATHQSTAANHGMSLSSPAAKLPAACYHKTKDRCGGLLRGSVALLAQLSQA